AVAVIAADLVTAGDDVLRAGVGGEQAVVDRALGLVEVPDLRRRVAGLGDLAEVVSARGAVVRVDAVTAVVGRDEPVHRVAEREGRAPGGGDAVLVGAVRRAGQDLDVDGPAAAEVLREARLVHVAIRQRGARGLPENPIRRLLRRALGRGGHAEQVLVAIHDG